jgi:hypothetical protein
VPTVETKQEAVNKTVKRAIGQFWLYGINYILVLIELVVLSLLTWASIGFDGFGFLITPQYIITTIALLMIYTSAHWTVFNLRVKRLRGNTENKAVIEKNEIEIKQTTNTMEWFTNSDLFLAERRIEKKVEAWKIYVRNRLTILNQKAKKKDRMIDTAKITNYQREHLSENDLLALQQRFDEERNNNAYCIKKRLYEQQLTDTWIAENLDKIHIDFDDVDKNFVETGSLLQGVKKSQTKEKGKYTKDTWQSRLVALLFTMFISAFAIDLLLNLDSGAWIIFGFRVLFFIINIVMGLDYADGFYRDVDLHNSLSRVRVKNEFVVWLSKKGKEV